MAIKDAKYLNPWSVINILSGLSGLGIDPLQREVATALEFLCKRILQEKNEAFTSRQNLLILNAAARFGAKHTFILAVIHKVVNHLKELTLPTEEAAQLLYNLALLENDEQKGVNETKLLFDEKIYQRILEQIPPIQEGMDVVYVNQLYMGFVYFTEIRKLKTFHEARSKGYLTAETIEKIKKGSTIVEGQPSAEGTLQFKVASHLKRIFAKLIEEHFIDTFPVDIFIENVCIVQVDGPRHFQFNFEDDTKKRTPKDSLTSVILEQSLIKLLHIPYDEWQTAVAKNKVRDYLREKLLSVGYQLTEAPQMTYQ